MRKYNFFLIWVVVLFMDTHWVCDIATADLNIRTSNLRHATGPRWVPNEIVVKFKSGVSRERINQINNRHRASVLSTSRFAGFKRVQTSAAKTAMQTVELYSREPEVEYAELNYYAYAFLVPNDPYYFLQWHFNDPSAGINIEPAWDITTGDAGVVIAVLDTGVAYEDYNNFELAPDLAGTLFVPGYNFVRDSEHANDDDGHGTHVAGTLAQTTNNNQGVAGIAFDCSIMPVKVLSKRGVGSYTDIADGIYFAADNGADIINMSLGGVGDSITLRDAAAYAYNQGVTIICAAGNEFEEGNLPSYPAAYDDYCIAVGATRYDRSRASYSNTGSYLDLVGPGGDLNFDQNADGYGDGILQQTFGLNPKDWRLFFYTGTSMAAPHVSGVAALLISTGVSGPDTIRQVLEDTALDLGPSGWDDEYGWGLVDAHAALNYYNNVPADFTGDGQVNSADLVVLLSFWLQDEPSVDIAPEPNGDGIINMSDFVLFSIYWIDDISP